MTSCYALLPCAGVGQRAGAPVPKQYQVIAGKTLVEHTLDAFASVPRIRQIVLVLAPHDQHVWPQSLPAHVHLAHVGGNCRASSVLNGLTHLLSKGARSSDWVLVHDAARPLITGKLIASLMDACLGQSAAQAAGGAILALPCPDTLKRQNLQNDASGLPHIAGTLERQGVWLAQTPQMFPLGQLRQALLAHQGSATLETLTDEASAMEMMGQAPLLVRGSAQNIKVTWPEDLSTAQVLLEHRKGS